MNEKPKGERQKELEDRPYLGEAGAPTGGGREGGRMARNVGSRDEKKRTFERPASVTRVRKADESGERRDIGRGALDATSASVPPA